MPTGVYERSEKEKQRLREMVKRIAPAVPKGTRLSKGTEFKKGHSPWNKGKKWPEMSGENHPSRNPDHAETFKRTTENFKANIFKAYGEDHPGWKGGITPLITKIRNSPRYAEWRKKVFERDEYSCYLCGDNRGGNLNAHHIKLFSGIIRKEKIKTYEQAMECEALWDTRNGLTLCESCHTLANEIAIALGGMEYVE